MQSVYTNMHALLVCIMQFPFMKSKAKHEMPTGTYFGISNWDTYRKMKVKLQSVESLEIVEYIINEN